MDEFMNIITENLKGDAVFYGRYSTRMQNETSIEGQFREAETFAKRNGITIIGRYADRAKTGQNDKRPEFQKMIDDILEGRISVKYVIVYKLDRIARNADVRRGYEKILNDNGVMILSATEPVNDTKKLAERLMKAFSLVMNEEAVRKISQNVLRGKKEAAYKGEWCGGTPPLGYDFDRNTRKLVINKNEAKIVKYAFKLRAEGFTYSYIIKKLNEKGYKTKLGNNFGKNSLYEIFRNIKYKGVYEYNRAVSKSKNGKINRHASKSEDEIIRIPDGCPQIVDEETWDKVNAMSRKRSGIKPKGNYLLSGLVVCKCGTVMQVNRRNNHNKEYYSFFCPAHKNKLGCDAREINMLDLEDFVLSQLADKIFDKFHIQKFIDDFREINKKKIRDSKNHIRAYKREINLNNQKIANCVSQIENGCSETVMGLLSSRIEELTKANKKLEKQILSSENDVEAPPTIAEIKALKDKFKWYMTSKVNLPSRKAYIQAFVEKIEVTNDEVTIIFNL